MAAAPDLLSALVSLLNSPHVSKAKFLSEQVERARAAIQKANIGPSGEQWPGTLS